MLISKELHQEIQDVMKKCFSCSKCISGCPVASAMDFPPGKMIKLIALGEVDTVLSSKAIWVCTSCQMCYSRCPFEINIPHIIDLLKESAYTQKIARKERSTRLFHTIFLANIKYFGRIHEPGLIGMWKMFSGNWFNDMLLGIKMFLKGKMRLFPEKVKKIDEIKKYFKA